MAKSRYTNEVKLLGAVCRNRSALMMSTALQATALLVLSLPAGAQPAPNARPTGGTVVAGAAAISQTSSNTRIDQSTQRAAVNWKNFDVGHQQSVTFHQPTTNSVTLNRVTGPDPSQIAGRIEANGQIVLVNQSGVTFYKGAQVNANGLLVSAAGISNRNFMAGVMKFDQPAKPNARIENQGSITIKEAGLAALVAPQVANSGVINAKLGHVVLAGAKTATLDLYGDGLLSLDVSNQVTQTPRDKNGNAATALVTNTGVIVADGGTVQLTARAADGIVQNLVQAGGKIQAATVGDRTGTVALNGVGGSIIVEGQIAATGDAPGTKGGAIELVTSGNAVVASTAKIDASGKAGGGLVALGTRLDRVKGGPGVKPTRVAATTVIKPGASISANATGKGDGGRVIVLSTKSTNMAGAINAKSVNGNGGFVEVSGDAGFSLTGAVDVSAPMGVIGSILLDPLDLFISAENPENGSGQITPNPTGVPADGLPNATTSSWLTPASINALTGAVTIATTRDLSVLSAVDTNKSGVTSLELNAGRDLTVNAPISTARIVLSAGNQVPTGALTLNSPIQSSAGDVSLFADSITINAPVTSANGFIFLASGLGGTALTGNAVLQADGLGILSGGAVSQAATSSITTRVLSSFGESDAPHDVDADLHLLGAANKIDRLGGLVVGGDLIVVNNTDLTLSGVIQASSLFFKVTKAGGTLRFGEDNDGFARAALNATGTGGRISLVADNYDVFPADPDSTPSSITATGGTVELAPFSAINTSLLGANGLVVGPTLLSIIQTGNGVLDIGGFTDVPAGATAPVASASSVSVGAVDLTKIASTLRLDSTGPITQSGGPLTVANLTGSAGISASLTQPTNQIDTLGAFSTTAGFALVNNKSLLVAGPVQDTGGGSTLALTTRTGDITLAGNVSATNIVDLVSAGMIGQSSGTLTAGTLAGNATDAVSLIGSNQIATLGNFGAGNFALTNGSDLLIGGALTAAGITVRAPASQITLGNDASIVTSGSIRPPGPIQPTLEPVNGAPGAYFQAANFTQIGSSTVRGQGSDPTTLQIDVTHNIQFDAQHSLQAPGSWLILNLTNGTAAGEVFVNALDVSYSTPGGANLRGAIQGVNDGTAAVLGSIQPAINDNYLFNGCIIAATVCQPIPPPAPPVLGLPDNVLTSALGGLYHPYLPGAPPAVIGLQSLVLVAMPMLPASRRQLTDPDVVPPNISYLDY